MSVIHHQGGNLMATLCHDADRCSRRSIQIDHQCALCLNQRLLQRLRREQHSIEVRANEIQRAVNSIDRHVFTDPLALEFLREVTKRAIRRIRYSVG